MCLLNLVNAETVGQVIRCLSVLGISNIEELHLVNAFYLFN